MVKKQRYGLNLKLITVCWISVRISGNALTNIIHTGKWRRYV